MKSTIANTCVEMIIRIWISWNIIFLWNRVANYYETLSFVLASFVLHKPWKYTIYLKFKLFHFKTKLWIHARTKHFKIKTRKHSTFKCEKINHYTRKWSKTDTIQKPSIKLERMGESDFFGMKYNNKIKKNVIYFFGIQVAVFTRVSVLPRTY